MVETDRTLFDRLSDELIDLGEAQPGTMMGFPCLKVKTRYFACKDKSSGALIVKLTEKRVKSLISSGDAKAFAPAGQLFKQWAMMDVFEERLWREVLREAKKLAEEA